MGRSYESDHKPPGYRTAQAQKARKLKRGGASEEYIAEQMEADLLDVIFWCATKSRAWQMFKATHPEWTEPPLIPVLRVVPKLSNGAAPSETQEQRTAGAVGESPRDDARQEKPKRRGGRKATRRLKRGELTDDQRQAIVTDYEDHPFVSMKELAGRVGTSKATVQRVVGGTPGLMQRVSLKRQELIIAKVETSLGRWLEQFEDAIVAGRLAPESMNPRDFAVAFGIMTDKRQILTGGATSRPGEAGPAESFEEQKKRMLAALEKTEGVLKLVKSGRTKAKLP